MDIYRIWKVCAQGSLERLLAPSGTSYKWLSHRGVHPSSGPIIQFPSFAQDSWISYWLQLVWPISPLLLYGFQSNLVSLESYFRGESNAVCYEGQGLLLMHRQLPKLRHSDHSRDIGGYQIRTPPFWTSPLLPRTFSFSLAPIWVRYGSFWTRNMTFTNRIVRV